MNGDHSEAAVPRNRYIAAAVTLAVVFTLSACTGDSGSTVPTTNVPVTTSPTPTVPVPTAPVQEATPESAIEFVKYFWALYNYAYSTLDTNPIEAASDSKCRFCSGVVDDVNDWATSKTQVSGFEVSIKSIVSPHADVQSQAVVLVIVKQEPGRLTDTSGEVTKQAGWKELSTTLLLLRDESGWRVRAVEADTKSGKPWDA
ncbi:DUF6318 family protein [Spongisporangium articulatum]|uniref:DUF6318 family protein n=1 Tax=Spongisporangium articulatum TaxID=3362603 RepID=A0ABW8AI80_9ACTN